MQHHQLREVLAEFDDHSHEVVAAILSYARRPLFGSEIADIFIRMTPHAHTDQYRTNLSWVIKEMCEAGALKRQPATPTNPRDNAFTYSLTESAQSGRAAMIDNA